MAATLNYANQQPMSMPLGNTQQAYGDHINMNYARQAPYMATSHAQMHSHPTWNINEPYTAHIPYTPIHSSTRGPNNRMHTYNVFGKRDMSTRDAAATSSSRAKPADNSGLAKVIKRIRLSSPEELDSANTPVVSERTFSYNTKNMQYGQSQPYNGATDPSNHWGGREHISTDQGPAYNVDNNFGASKVTPLDDRPMQSVPGVGTQWRNQIDGMQNGHSRTMQYADNDYDCEMVDEKLIICKSKSKPEDMQVVLYSGKDRDVDNHRANFNSIPAHVLSNLSHRPLPVPTDLNSLVVYNESVARGRSSREDKSDRPDSPECRVEEIDDDEDDDIMLM
ncbi:hypothetical protein SARC_07672 [Sphaeroforma arctica JP610]|uniref:Uncharacterized protein n=1 Tax=Sphaeroforma arctica JP610 TaxID=667725 RepID=A0A0L0FTQ2_9EUKA|nr:hypothetical protein SARC_07672 [Sphaeroforma arctica JP610]KNC79956.1 hypothetical protein SARC_07672 [Sphaeroforma arctica JP610]|eukprot:XP_014153858.1 hypothetical protein SARC_07672 [Sphaeroforma arctica JP610]